MIINFIQNNSSMFWTLVGIVITIIASIITLTYDKDKKVISIYALTQKIVDLSKTPISGLSVEYNNKKVNNLTQTTMVLWNSRKKPIMSNEVSDNDTIKLSLKGDGEIISAHIEKRNSNEKNITLCDTKEPNTYELTFTHLKTHEGCRIKFVHTSTAKKPIQVSGVLITGDIAANYNTRKKSAFVDMFKAYNTSKLQFILKPILASLCLALSITLVFNAALTKRPEIFVINNTKEALEILDEVQASMNQEFVDAYTELFNVTTEGASYLRDKLEASTDMSDEQREVFTSFVDFTDVVADHMEINLTFFKIFLGYKEANVFDSVNYFTVMSNYYNVKVYSAYSLSMVFFILFVLLTRKIFVPKKLNILFRLSD